MRAEVSYTSCTACFLLPMDDYKLVCCDEVWLLMPGVRMLRVKAVAKLAQMSV